MFGKVFLSVFDKSEFQGCVAVRPLLTRRPWALLCLFLVTSLLNFDSVLAYSNIEKAEAYSKEAGNLMKAKKDYKAAIDLLRKAQKLDPKNAKYQYELAYAYLGEKYYRKSLKQLRNLDRKGEEREEYIRLEAEVHQAKKDWRSAERALVKGVEKFPESGVFYADLAGLYYSNEGNNDKAIEWWEKGIKEAPQYAGNYYWAAMMYCRSSEKLWGLLYGELFILLEPNTDRTKKISKLLFDTYKASIISKGDSLIASFNKSARLNLLLFNPNSEELLSFPLLYEKNANEVLNRANLTNLQSLVYWRKRIEAEWEADSNYSLYTNVLLDWHYNLKQEGHLEAYNYWLFQYANEKEFSGWRAANKFSYGAFADWFNLNPIALSKDCKFYRLQLLEEQKKK